MKFERVELEYVNKSLNDIEIINGHYNRTTRVVNATVFMYQELSQQTVVQ